MKINIRIIVFSIIIIICIFALNFGVYWQFFRKTENTPTNPNNPTANINYEQLAKDFKDIFSNTLDYQGHEVNISGITKLKANEDLIYTWVNKEASIENKYDLTLNIPRVNISSVSAEKFNENIKNIYVNKANDIILHSTSHTIYTVEYMSYINTNILSLVIKSTLKEGNNPQRVIIQTYNYNLSTNEEVTFNQMLEIKGLHENEIKASVIKVAQNANVEAEELKNLGYNVFIRDLSSNIYEPSNISNFILGKDNYLYVIYPYGNSNFTDAMDVVVF